MEPHKHLKVVLWIYSIYVCLILIANILMHFSVARHSESLEALAGIVLGIVAIPIFSLILPLWLAKTWGLPCSFWPKTKNWKHVVLILLVYLLLANFEPIKAVMASGVTLRDFAIHYIAVLLFHVTYYPLLAIFMFPVLRARFGLTTGIVLTALAFALYHLAQFHNFPAGTTFIMQIFLFAAFVAHLLLYLWSESIILLAVVHNTSGALALSANGALFNQFDFVFFLTLVIMSALFAYMIYQERQDRKYGRFTAEWWLQVRIQ